MIATQLLLGALALLRFTVADDDNDGDQYPVMAIIVQTIKQRSSFAKTTILCMS